MRVPAVPVSNAEELSKLYVKSCEKHKTEPFQAIIDHLQSLNFENLSSERTEMLNLRQQTLTHESCETLEELFKRVKYKLIDLTSCKLDDISSTSLFDMIEYYEACNELNISENTNIKNRGLQSCKSISDFRFLKSYNVSFFTGRIKTGINMIKRSQALHSLSMRGTMISDSNGKSFISLKNRANNNYLQVHNKY